ncbi:uncharacterized protein LOC113860795 [Abrus precatorius]|uniref:Uncharacterized protein LOC113860795 n=1 Tax=Abrus precatorius TaxID=3816 RepID=A0A8B8KYW3_ABRPR|nr:uncharacterized protein LOC113860795 [Abrus precatorius]
METLAYPKLQDDAMRELYEASLNGCVNTLNTLIQRDPLILIRVSLYPFSETPLHIASLLGHLEFCQVLLLKNPSLATELNSEGRCPLHLAAAKGHTQIVKALLLTNQEMCLVRDKDDMLPLHFAAMRGHVEAIKELIKAKPDSIWEMTATDDGSVLHLCVRYNHLEALKLLVELVRGDHQFLSAKDKEDYTVLHLAVRRRQIKIIKYLLSLSEMSTAINTLNKEGLTVMEILKRYPRDFVNLTIEHILTEGVQNEVIAQEPVSSPTQVSQQQTKPTPSQNIAVVFVQQEAHSPSNNVPPQAPNLPSPNNGPQHAEFPLSSNDPEPAHLSPNNDPPQPSPSTSLHTQQTPTPSPNNDPSQSSSPSSSSNGPLQRTVTSSSIPNNNNENSRWNRLESFCRTYLLSQGNFIDKKTREQLMVAATVIATMTFQSVISPPGGVWQSDTTSDGHACVEYGFCEAGTAVVGYAWSPDFIKFVFFNTASFFSSLCVVLVLISGFPLENKVIMWVLAVLMIVSASCMLLTYMWALGLVSPNHIYYRIRNMGYVLVGSWAFLLALVGLIQASRIMFWARSRRKSSINVIPSHSSP